MNFYSGIRKTGISAGFLYAASVLMVLLAVMRDDFAGPAAPVFQREIAGDGSNQRAHGIHVAN